MNDYLYESLYIACVCTIHNKAVYKYFAINSSRKSCAINCLTISVLIKLTGEVKYEYKDISIIH